MTDVSGPAITPADDTADPQSQLAAAQSALQSLQATNDTIRQYILQFRLDFATWMRAFNATKLIKTDGSKLTQDEPIEAWTELMARAAMQDSAQVVFDGEPPDGAVETMATRVAAQIRNLAGDPEFAQARANLAKHAEETKNGTDPQSALLRNAVDVLNALTAMFPVDHNVRTTAARILAGPPKGLGKPALPGTPVAEWPRLPDLLYRQLVESGIMGDVLANAYDAACRLIAVAK